MLLVPILTWGALRTTWAQRVCDLLRTMPLLLYVTAAFGMGIGFSWLSLIVVLSWTGVANIAMFGLDFEHDAAGGADFGVGGQTLYAASLLSPVAFLTGTPAFLTGMPHSGLMYAVIAVNVSAAAYLVFTAMLAWPYTNAWACYPHPRTLDSLRFGYCPQWDDNYVNNIACRNLGLDTGRCSADNSDKYRRDLHSETGAITHFALHALTLSGAMYVAQIPQVVFEMKNRICRKSR